MLKAAIGILGILILALLLFTSIWLLNKVDTGVGPVPRWKVGQVWAKNFFEMPSIYRAGYGMGRISTPISAIGEPVSTLLKGEISWTEIPARSSRIIRVILEMGSEGVGIYPALFPRPDF